MKTPIRLLAIVGVVAVAAVAFASLPALAQDDVNRTAPRLNVPRHEGGLLTLDRNYDNEQPSPQPIVPPDKDPKPGRLMGAPNGPFAEGDNSGSVFGSAVLGGGGAVSSKSERIERSLRTTADRLR